MLTEDFKEFLLLLNEEKVDYMIVGGYAVGIYGYPRYTGDIDIWVNPTEKNAKKVLKTLVKFGFGDFQLKTEDFQTKDLVIQLGYPPQRIDILTSVDALDFEESYQHKMVFEMGDLEVNVVGYNELIKNKEATNRLQDRNDVEQLKRKKR